ncbi:H0502G05.11 protein [Theobroma cacao]|uniref:H0502G05.11 protein n=1 Tax=Theobroma cacao TaxID=3641 RepID=A0A061FVS6_THECC|nr:H0502G05.11 protein [Theobroma cacao]
MMETITQFASSTAITFQPQPMLTHNGENAANMVNNNKNGGNGESTTDPFLNTTNPSIVGNSITVTPSTSAQSFVIEKELKKLLDQKNKSLNFSKFDLKLPYPAKVATKPYPKDYISPKFKQFNGKTSDAREHVMKFVKTLGFASLDDNLKLKEFSKSLIEKTYTWHVNLTPGSVDS